MSNFSWSQSRTTHYYHRFSTGDVLNVLEILGVVARVEGVSGNWEVKFLFNSAPPLSCGYYAREKAEELREKLVGELFGAIKEINEKRKDG